MIAGFGFSHVPEPYVKDDLLQGRLGTVLDDWDIVETSVYAVYPTRLYMVLKVRVFLDFLAEELGVDISPQRCS